MPKSKNPTAADIVKAHQFLYYVEANPVLTDQEYDAFCKRYGIEGSGGSDSRSDYSDFIIALAGFMVLRPTNELFTQPKK